jgi:hypothetical protein
MGEPRGSLMPGDGEWWACVEKTNTYVVPNFMSFLGRCSELHFPISGSHDNTVLMQSWWHRIGIHDGLDRLDISYT